MLLRPIRSLLMILTLAPWAVASDGSDAKSFSIKSQDASGIQAAIDEASEAGGGVVLLPAGELALDRYVYLRSNVTLRGRASRRFLPFATRRHRPL